LVLIKNNILEVLVVDNKKLENIKLYQLVKSLSRAMDLISETVVGHHKKVAYISLKLGESFNLNDDEKYFLLLNEPSFRI
jgi:HD superfamily phosphodiesterase